MLIYIIPCIMSKKRITSAVDSGRIQKKTIKTPTGSCIREGLVITSYNRKVLIEDVDGIQSICFLRSQITPLVAGDRVQSQQDVSGQGIVVHLHPRTSVLGRPDKRGHYKVIAANITKLLIVIAPLPEVSWVLLDRYLIMAEHLKIPACIVLNKTDLACDEVRAHLLNFYAPLGYEIVFTQYSDTLCPTFLAALKGHISVFVGQSGVGKSSLINRLLPDLPSLIHTGPLSINGSFGTHTTRNARYYAGPWGGAVIDSPGVRDFLLWEMSTTEIAWGYREFRSYIAQCKFRDCEHHHTPGCALTLAVKNKSISPLRYQNYVKIAGIVFEQD